MIIAVRGAQEEVFQLGDGVDGFTEPICDPVQLHQYIKHIGGIRPQGLSLLQLGVEERKYYIAATELSPCKGHPRSISLDKFIEITVDHLDSTPRQRDHAIRGGSNNAVDTDRGNFI